MAKTKYAPASGIPARGVGTGDGWGGPARGAGTGGPAKAFPGGPVSADRSPEAVERRRLFAKAKEDRIEQLVKHLGTLALNAEREETQVSATIAVLNRLDGLPVATNLNKNVEMTWEQMVQASLKTKSEG